MFWNIFFFFSFCNHLKMYSDQIRSDQLLSRVRPFATPWIAARQDSLSITNSQSSLTHIRRVSDAIQPSHLLSSPSSLAPNPSQHQSLSNESTLCMRWPKYWSFSFSITPSKKSQGWSPSEWTGWISLQSKGLSRVFSNTKFKGINSSALSLLHSPTLTSIHDHRKNHSLD